MSNVVISLGGSSNGCTSSRLILCGGFESRLISQIGMYFGDP